MKINVKPRPKSPNPPAMAAAGNIEVPRIAPEKIRAAPPVTIGKTTRDKTINHKNLEYFELITSFTIIFTF